MRIFVYEHVTGGGTFGESVTERPSGSLLEEGTAMARTLVADFAAVPGVEVRALQDARLTNPFSGRCTVSPVASRDQQRQFFDRLAGTCDATVLIAPEISGTLLACCRRAVAAGATLISPGESAVELASDKLALARCLADNGIPMPHTRAVSCGDPLPRDFVYPAVLKPAWGAGSTGIQLIHAAVDRCWSDDSGDEPDWLLQEFCAGTPVSVAFVCRPSGRHPMVPCRQRVSDDGRFRYLGGELSLPPQLARRATRLATRVVETAMPGVEGFVGVDLVLGDDPSGGADRVIEINPRLTTSYVGLRAAAETNLAAAMLAAANDRRPDMRFSRQSLQFDADGTVRRGVVPC